MPAWDILSYKARIEGSACRGAYVLLFGGTDMLSYGGAFRDSRGAGPMCVRGRLLLCGGLCVRRVAPECAR